MTMRSYVTSYNALFTRRAPDTPVVERIEIPLIQRDYAQGRKGGMVERIRTSFLNVLHSAVTGGEGISLDFVYGDVENGTLRPLDGQQRLTTLFLLHWYLAFRAERISQVHGWKRFSYATRASARLFCERLAECQPPPAVENLSAWIEDRSWYLHTWRHDPTVQSMLVMLDAMHERFREDDCLTAWERLIDADEPAISFHLLPIEQMGLSEDLYIKMNSRGIPLTTFENFKARFEQVLEASCPERVEEFALKVDGAWSDLLWRYRGSDCIVDDEFLRYFNFVTEVCEWHEGRLEAGDIEFARRARLRSEQPKVLDPSRLLVSSLRHMGERRHPSCLPWNVRGESSAARLGRHEQGRALRFRRPIPSVLPELRTSARPQSGVQLVADDLPLRSSPPPHPPDGGLRTSPARPSEPRRSLKQRASLGEDARAPG